MRWHCPSCLNILHGKTQAKKVDKLMSNPQTSTVTISKDLSQNSEPLPDPKRAPPICSYYRKGRCRHGISGRKLVFGKECKFLHPKKCIKYCRYGNDLYQGCQGSCGLFHPMLCFNSIQYKMCNNRECTFQHLTGTELHRSSHSQYPLYSGKNDIPRMFQSGITNNDSFQPPIYGWNRKEKSGFVERNFPPSKSSIRNELQRMSHSGHSNKFPFQPATHGWIRKDNFGLDERNYLPPKSSLDAKIEENSSAILNMQRSLDKLIKEIHKPANSQEILNNFQNPWNNSFAPQQFEAKNGNNPNFPK